MTNSFSPKQEAKPNTTVQFKCIHCGKPMEKKPDTGMPYCPSCHEREREANYFAACLLMPENLVRDWLLANGPFSLTDDDQLKKLAKDFQVSMTLAAIRLFQLGVFIR